MALAGLAVTARPASPLSPLDWTSSRRTPTPTPRHTHTPSRRPLAYQPPDATVATRPVIWPCGKLPKTSKISRGSHLKSTSRVVYEFGPFRLDPAEQLLLRDGCQVPLSPKVLHVLRILVERAGHLVDKEVL